MSLLLKDSDRSNISSDKQEAWGFTYYDKKRSKSFLYSNQQIAGAGKHTVKQDVKPLFSTSKLLLGKNKLRWTRKVTPFVQESTVNNIGFYQNRCHMIDSQKRSIISDMFLTRAKSSNAKDFDRRHHCCFVCWQNLLFFSFLRKRARSMWLISKADHSCTTTQ